MTQDGPKSARIEELLGKAEEAEAAADFEEAHRVFLLAASELDSLSERDRANTFFARAVRCFENTQHWRVYAHLWEFVGDRFSEQEGLAARNDAGLDGIRAFVTYWADPELGYYRTD